MSQGKVTVAEPGREFVFECSMMDFHYATWGYRIEPTAGGARVTEWSEDLRPESVLEMAAQMSGVADRAERNRETMSGTLDRVAESPIDSTAGFDDRLLVAAHAAPTRGGYQSPWPVCQGESGASDSSVTSRKARAWGERYFPRRITVP